MGRAHIPSGEDTHTHEGTPGAGPARQQLFGRVAEARDPVRPAGPGEVGVAIDERGNERRASRVDDLGAGGVRFAVARAEIGDAIAAHHEGDIAFESRGASVRESRAANVDRGHYSTRMVLMTSPILMPVTTSMPLST